MTHNVSPEALAIIRRMFFGDYDISDFKVAINSTCNTCVYNIIRVEFVYQKLSIDSRVYFPYPTF